MLYGHKNQPTCSAMHTMRSIYIMANRFLRSSGYMVGHEVFSTFGCHFPSKRCFEKSNNAKVYLNLTLTWWC